MPIIKYNKLPEGVHWAVWKLTESLSELQTLWPPSLELPADVLALPSEQKKRESLGGRLTVYALLSRLGVSPSEIQKDIHGKPFLTGGGGQISVTHTKEYVAACWHATNPVGMDLERPSEKIRRVIPRLFVPQEIEWMQDDTRRMTWGWSGKEALYKLYGKRGLDFKNQLRMVQKNEQFIGQIMLPDNCSMYQFYITEVGDYQLVIAY